MDLQREQVLIDIVIITGASRGIGRALALQFAKHGCNLMLVARDRASIEAQAVALKSEFGVKAFAFSCDLALDESPAKIAAECCRLEANVIAVINNAAVMSRGLMQTMSPATVQNLVNINVRAATELSLVFTEQMVRRGHGTVLNISSLASFGAIYNAGLYSASKAYLSSFSRGLDRELAGTGVRCMDITLGPVRTDMLVAARNNLFAIDWKHLVAMPADSAAAVIYDGYAARRWHFSVGFLAVTVGTAAQFLPRPLVNAVWARLT
jgi:uncharacterized protein